MNNEYLANLVQDYRLRNSRNIETSLVFYKGLPTIEEVIKKAAMAITPKGKRNPHQRRLKKVVLERVKDRLLANKESLLRAKSFDDIKGIVEECSVSGFGVLAVYDTSLRIGSWLGPLPKMVYLHAGTTEGARPLGLDSSRKVIQMNELPEPLKDLEPYHVENFLCIYKKRIKNPFLAEVDDCMKKIEC
jgi:hypothetical protein